MAHRVPGNRPCWRALLERTSYLVGQVFKLLIPFMLSIFARRDYVFIGDFFSMDLIDASIFQGLLHGVLLSCSFIRLMKEENTQSLCTSLERNLLISVMIYGLVFFLFLLLFDDC